MIARSATSSERSRYANCSVANQESSPRFAIEVLQQIQIQRSLIRRLDEWKEKGAPSFPLFGGRFLKFGEVFDYRIVGRGTRSFQIVEVGWQDRVAVAQDVRQAPVRQPARFARFDNHLPERPYFMCFLPDST
jgi:hypothetical protein